MVQAPLSSTVNAAPVRLYVLGPFRLTRQEQAFHLATRKVEALLAFLALHPGPHPREELAALFWGDSSDEQARRSLRTALASIRKELGDVLFGDRESVELDPEIALWVDALAFEQSVSNDSGSAVALYQGPLLAGFYDDWILQERERLHALYIDALLRLAQQARSEGRYPNAIDFAQKTLDQDPANEKAYQHIIFCLAAVGDRTSALKYYEECEKALREELGVEPSQETVALRDRIRQELTGSKSREALFTNLPHPLTSFVGRENEITEIKGLLEQHRLVTLTGPGGCGKTRLAIEVASQRMNSFRDGVWWVELAPLSDSFLVPQRVAQALGMSEQADQSFEQTLLTFLRDRQLLLILDNCEHLISACADLVAKLLTACSELRVLTTSREGLRITGEMAWSVPSLSVPEATHLLQVEELMHYDAIRLFAERAAIIQARWKVYDHALAVAHVCRRLDGIPLAIELASARMKVLSVEEIAIRLNDRFNLLTEGSRTALPRQQTLRATMDWSHALLSAPERILFRRLSVFAGSFGLEAIESICSGDGIEKEQVLDLLSGLFDKSLVLVQVYDSAERYRMLETIRQYAREKLYDSGEGQDLRHRHLEYFTNWVEAVEPKLRGAEQLFYQKQLEVENDNLRAALDWSADQNVEAGLRLASALVWFWDMSGYWQEGWERLTILLSQLQATDATLVCANALFAAGLIADLLDEPKASIEYLERAIAIARKQGQAGKRVLAFALCILSYRWLDQNSTLAQSLFDEGWTIAQELADQWLIARILYERAYSLMAQRDYDKVRILFEESMALFHSLGDRHWEVFLSYHIAQVDYSRRDYTAARLGFERDLPFCYQIKDCRGIWVRLNALGEIARSQGNYALAKEYHLQAYTLSQEMGRKDRIALSAGNLGVTVLREGDLAQARILFAEHLRLGKEMGQTLRFALREFAYLAATQNQMKRATRLLAASNSVQRVTDEIIMNPADEAEHDHYLNLVRSQLDEVSFNAAWSAGRAMTVEQAVGYALEQT